MFVTHADKIFKVRFSYWFGIGQIELLLVQHMEINHRALQFPPHINAKKTKLSKLIYTYLLHQKTEKSK